MYKWRIDNKSDNNFGNLKQSYCWKNDSAARYCHRD